MIHNNLRKILKTLAHNAPSSIPPSIEQNVNYTDITGYTGSSLTDDVLGMGAKITYNKYLLGTDLRSTSSVTTTADKINSTTAFIYCQIGNTSSNEPDYNLGTVLSNNLVCTTDFTFNAGIALWNATIYNSTNNDIIFNEVGLFLHGYGSNDSYKWNGLTNNYTQRCFLLIKEVLPQSMTLEANSSITFSFNILGDVT